MANSLGFTAAITCAVLLSAVPEALKADSVAVRFFPGNVLNAEWMDVRIERRDTATDHFFRAVRMALTENHVIEDWEYVAPDASFIEITIEQNDKRVKLSSMHTLVERDARLVATSRGIEPLGERKREDVLAVQTKQFRQYREAFERVLKLVEVQVRQRFSANAMTNPLMQPTRRKLRVADQAR